MPTTAKKQGVGKRQIQFYNFELPENYLNKIWDDIYFELKKKLQADKPNYVFLDEVQNIPFFEKLVDGLFARIVVGNTFSQCLRTGMPTTAAEVFLNHFRR